MIFQKYIIKEITYVLIATLLVLLGIVLSTRLASYLSRAASGLLTQSAILELLGLQLLRFFTDLMPLSFLLASLLALGRFYRDSEMTAMFALGFSLKKLYQTLFLITTPLAILLIFMNFFVLPYTFGLQKELQNRARNEAQQTIFKAGVFRELLNGRFVVYVGELDNKNQILKNIFIHQTDDQGLPSITLAKSGIQHIDQNDQRFLILQDGMRYQKTINNEDYTLQFDEIKIKLDRLSQESTQETKAITTETLFTQLFSNDTDPRIKAEMQRRLAGPISLFMLALLIPMLAHTKPREGRFNRLITGIALYALYFNLLAISEAWITKGYVPAWIGLWWVHLLFLGFGLVIQYRRGRQI